MLSFPASVYIQPGTDGSANILSLYFGGDIHCWASPFSVLLWPAMGDRVQRPTSQFCRPSRAKGIEVKRLACRCEKTNMTLPVCDLICKSWIVSTCQIWVVLAKVVVPSLCCTPLPVPPPPLSTAGYQRTMPLLTCNFMISVGQGSWPRCRTARQTSPARPM